MNRDPETIGRYRVLDRLGIGGMGVVYLAEDPVLKRRVAVKLVLGAAGSTDEILTRFRREAELSAQLNHPNIITVFDVGEEEGFGPFLAMELIDGSNLGDLIKKGDLDDDLRLKILHQTAEALDAVHSAGVVHRDIKPANVMLTHAFRVKLMDFGVARGDESELTKTGVMMGTPAYLAPEQLKGASPSSATDRYAFGALAFELFTGQRPYRATTPSVVLYNIMSSPPEIPEETPAELADVLSTALAKEPSERYADLADFLRALASVACLDDEARGRWLAVLGRKPDPARLSPSPARRSRFDDLTPLAVDRPKSSREPIAAVAGVLLLLLAMGIWSLGSPGAWPSFRVVSRPPPPADPRGSPPTTPRSSSPEAPANDPALPTPAPVARRRAGARDPAQPASVPAAVAPSSPVAPTPVRPAPTLTPGEAGEDFSRDRVARPDQGRGDPTPARAPREVVGGEPPREAPGAPAPVAALPPSSRPPSADSASTAPPSEGSAPLEIPAMAFRPAAPPVSTPVRLPTPTRDALERSVRRELDSRRLEHVEVEIDTRRRAVLANLSDRKEELRARRIVEKMDSITSVRTILRVSPSPTSKPKSPGWGSIQRDGAQQTE